MLNQEKLEKRLSGCAPSLADGVRTYVSEANFFFEALKNDLESLPENARVLEIGSGVGLLSLMLAETGFSVVAIEPQSAGFKEMHEIQGILMDCWQGTIPEVEWRFIEFTYSPKDEGYDYAIAINVLEHVPAWEPLIGEVARALKNEATFRVVFPNYIWPYEPHFRLPTIWNKKLSGILLAKKIRKSSISSPLDFWQDLSWLSSRKLMRASRSLHVELDFTKHSFTQYFYRLSSDKEFIARMGTESRMQRRLLIAIGMKLTRLIPARFLPVIDCRISSPASSAQPN